METYHGTDFSVVVRIIWLITLTPQDTDPSPTSPDQWTYRTRHTLVVVFLCLVILLPLSAKAFFSFLEVVRAQVSADAPSTTHNSQTLTLLSVLDTAEYLKAKGGGDVLIEDNALVVSNRDDGGEVAPASGNSLYVVREGDTLSTISSLFGISTQTIRLANNISSNGVIHPGDMLEIPPTDGIPYIVKKGDTLSTIAKAFGVSTADILDGNIIFDETSIKIGEKLFIPGGKLAQSSSKTTSTKQVSSSKRDSSKANGYYTDPMAWKGRLTQGYHGRFWGIDIGAPIGTPVVAAASGVVRLASGSGWNGGYGHFVAIDHSNGSQTMYAHLSRVIVSIGQRVEKGQVIAYSGNTGRSTGPHLHFEIRDGINPPLDRNW